MKLARFSHDGTVRFGVVGDDHVVALDHRVRRFNDLLANPAAAGVTRGDPRLDRDRIAWLPPFTTESKILCVGLNYPSHDGDGDRRAGDHPTLFGRFPDSFVGSGDDVAREADSHTLDWEGEVAVVIGRAGRRIARDDAWNHVAGLTCMAENSERTWQIHSAQATAGKNWAASGACGPWITTLDEVGRKPVTLTTRLNGQVVQYDSTANLIFDIPALLGYTSTFTQLQPGDVIATGTPAGVGYRQHPPRFLTPGDELEVEVSGVGILRHGVTDGPTAVTSVGSAHTSHPPVGGTS